MKLQEISMK
jgi:hypothetical protein